MNCKKYQCRLILFFLIISKGLVLNGQNYDRFYGRTDLKIEEGTGFFKLGKIGDKHFLVTPEGNAFRAIGINHTHMNKSMNYDGIVADLKSKGFNSGDYQGPVWMWDRIPYSKGIQLLETSTWLAEDKFKFEDVFDSEFLSSLETKIKNIVQPQANNTNLICYFLIDVPVWEIEKFGKSWIKFYKSLDENSAGGKEWSTWKTNNPNSPEADFIRIIARQLYSKATEFIRKYDKNHLIFSDRYIEYHFPESIVFECLPFVDGIAIQPKNYLTISFFDEVYKKYKKPIFIADHVTSYATDEYSNTMGQVAKNAEDYVEFYRKSVTDMMSLPYVVGYNKCQYMDEVKGTQLKQGLYKQNGEPYEYLDSLKGIHEKALELAYKVADKNMSEHLQDWGKYENVKKEAIQRIEEHRKGDVHIKAKGPDEKTISNADIRVKLKRHDFKWGAVVGKSFVTSPYSHIYKETFLKYFNASGFNIALKPKHRDTQTEEIAANQTMPWFVENDIYVRGHALTWEGENFMRPEDKLTLNSTSLTDKEKGDILLNSMGKHFTHAIPRWDVKCWDVTNEPIANNDVNNLFPNFDTHAYWFNLADSIREVRNRKDVLLFENDYQIISAISSWALKRPAQYRKIIDNHIALGAPVEGIGFQSRIKHGIITPDTIYKRLCDFEKYNLPYHATEFEIRDDQTKYVYTDKERELITEYMMIMYFSHPKVEGFWHWTFADMSESKKLDYPLFNYDGTPKVNGEKWIKMMEGFFNTDVNTTTNFDGETDVRGYYGSYEITTELNGEKLFGTFEIDSTNTEPIITVYLEKSATTSTQEIENKNNKKAQIRFDSENVYVHINSPELYSKHMELEIYDLLGKQIYSERITNKYTIISSHEITKKGLSIAIVKDLQSGERMASGKIILM